MTDIAALRAACAAQLAGVATTAGVRVYDAWPGQINAPCVVVTRRRADRATEFDGGHTTVLAVVVFLPSTDAPSAQDALDALLSETGASSIPAALVADTSWGGVVRSAILADPVEEEGLVDPYGLGVMYLSASVPVTVVHA